MLEGKNDQAAECLGRVDSTPGVHEMEVEVVCIRGWICVVHEFEEAVAIV